MASGDSPNARTGWAIFFTECSPMIGERQRQLGADLVARHARQAQAARLAQRFQPGRDVDAVAEDVVAVDDDVADVDADAEHDAAGLPARCALRAIIRAGR